MNSQKITTDINLDNIKTAQAIIVSGSKFSGSGISDTTYQHYGTLLVFTARFDYTGSGDRFGVIQIYMEYTSSIIYIRHYWPNTGQWNTRAITSTGG